jgi:isopentenyl-diphosphate delta-isomerase
MNLRTPLTEVFTFLYKAYVGNGLIENEFDHVFFGSSNKSPNPDPDEVSEWNWITIEELKQELLINPLKFSPWLRQCFNRVSSVSRGGKYGDEIPNIIHLSTLYPSM